MTTLTTLNGPACDVVRKALKKALADLDLGIQIDIGKMTYQHDGSLITCKLSMSLINSDGVAQTAERTDFTQQATLYGLKPSDLDRAFDDYDGTKCVIVGLKPRSRKYPILIKKNGKTFKYPAQRVVQALASQ